MPDPRTTSLYTFSSNLFDLRMVQAYALDPRLMPAHVYVGGSIHRQGTIEVQSLPQHRIETHDLLTLQANVSLMAGNKLTSATFPAQLRAEGPTIFEPVGDSVHYRITSPGGGYLRYERISGRQGDPEGIQIALLFDTLFDGVNKPNLISLDNLTGISVPAFISRYFPGPIVVVNSNGSLFTRGKINFDINFQSEFEPAIADGDCYARTGYLIEHGMEITVDFLSADAIDFDTTAPNDRRPASLFLEEAAVGGTIELYFLRGKHGTTRFTGANHMKLTISTPAWHISQIGGRGKGYIESTWKIWPVGGGASIQFVNNVAAPFFPG